MKIKKQYIIICFTLLILVSSAFLFKEKELPIIVPYEKNYTEVEIVPEISIPIKEAEKKNIQSVESEIKTIKVTLTVLDKKYNTEIRDGSSVIEAMEKIESESNSVNEFTFKYTDNASLGNFITEINEEKGTPGKYWIYYINGKLASIGVSQYILKDGDIINWNQEGM